MKFGGIQLFTNSPDSVATVFLGLVIFSWGECNDKVGVGKPQKSAIAAAKKG